MSVREQLERQTWAVSSDYSEVLPYLGKEGYEVSNTYRRNGLFDKYFVSLI